MEEDEGDCWFQQDGAMCHISNETLFFLGDVFGDCLISKACGP
jgi:hypothetical protein